MNRSSILKSTLVMDAYAPGDIAFIKRCRESWAMTTLSTVIRRAEPKVSESETTYRGRCFRIHWQRQGDDTCHILFRPGPREWSEVRDAVTVPFAGQSLRNLWGVDCIALKWRANIQPLHK
jgi:hypothetical protein